MDSPRYRRFPFHLPTPVLGDTPDSPEPAATAPAGGGRRLAAGIVDICLAVACVAALTVPMISAIESTGSKSAYSAVWALGSTGGDLDAALSDFTDTVIGRVTLVVEIGLAVLLTLEFIHQVVGLRWRGCTIGKALFGLRVRRHTTTNSTRRSRRRDARRDIDARWNSGPGPASGAEPGAIGPRQAASRAAMTTLADLGLPAASVIALLHGAVFAALVCLAGWMAVLAVRVFAVLGRRRTPLDVLARTVVVHKPAMALNPTQYRSHARTMTKKSRTATTRVKNTVSDHVPHQLLSQNATQKLETGKRNAASLGRGAWRAAGHMTQGVAADERVRRTLSSDRAQAFQNTGRSALGRGRAVWRSARRPGHDDTAPPPAPDQAWPQQQGAAQPPTYPPHVHPDRQDWHRDG